MMGEALSEYLSPGELHSLTGYARCGQQSDWLSAQGIPKRLDGKRAADLAEDSASATKLLQHSSAGLVDKHYRTKPTKLKAVR